MTKIFSSYTNTVRKMIKGYNVELYNLFSDKIIDEVWVEHDNWNGGIDFYNLVINIPVELFEDLRKSGRLEKIEKMIDESYSFAMRGEGDSIQIRGVFLKPSVEEISFMGEDVYDSMWKPGLFRLFISHLTSNKESASNLKLCLSDYGIDCFVAHEDIVPSKEWEIEIEKSLFTMDALCAIIVPDFLSSHWCDQEVGFALGQRKLVLPINKGSLPYGFLGKYQALKSNNDANDVAKDVWKILSTNERTRQVYLTKLTALILNATNTKDALKYIEVLNQCENVNKHYIENLHNNFMANNILNSYEVITAMNSIFSNYGLMPLKRSAYTNVEIDNSDLPF